MGDSVPGKLQNETKSDSRNKEKNENKEKETADIICGPCFDYDKEVCAEGFCVDCQDYLCENCFKCHCIPKPTKYHRVLDKNDMPKRKVERDLSDVCPKHKGEIMKHYCKDHDVIGCYSCIYPEHNSCSNTCLLEDAICGTDFSQMYKDFFKSVSDLKEEFDKQSVKAKQNSVDSYYHNFETLESIKSVQEKINDYFKQLHDDIIQKAETLKSEDYKKARHIKERSKTAIEELHHLKEDLQLLEETKQSKQLFMVINGAKQKHDHLEECLKSLKLENTVRIYKFIPNPKLETLIKEINDLGKLSIEK